MWYQRIAHSVRIRVQYLLGKGFRRRYFDQLYSARAEDAWGYGQKPHHAERMRFAVESIPPGAIDRAVEVGCAEGHMTRLLAQRVRSLVALDLAAEAVRRAAANCADLPNVEFMVADIREGIPAGRFDLAVCSDVLLYLSPSELWWVIRSLERSLGAGGCILVAEFSPLQARLPSSLEDVVRLCRERGWTLLSERETTLRESGEGVRVVVFRWSPDPAAK